MPASSLPLRSIALTLMLTACVGDPGSQTAGDADEDTGTTSDDTHVGTLSHGSTSPNPSDDGPSPGTTLNVFPSSTDPGDEGIDDVGEDVGSEIGESTIDGEPSTTGTELGSTSDEPIALPVCGNGVVEDSEQCDDGGNLAGDFCGATCQFEAQLFDYSGAPVAITIPDWMSTARMEAWGAEGGGSECCDGTLQDDGGLGGWATGVYDVVPGDTLTIYVGGKGVRSATGGFNGGGAGGLRGGGGGGASDVRTGLATLDERIIVAGGGGGGSCGCFETGAGGDAGGDIGASGIDAGATWVPGHGGTMTGGGAPGSSPGEHGVFGVGGSGTPLDSISGGGGGRYGGGAAFGSGGGGGSSWVGDSTDADTAGGVRLGDGMVMIRPAE